MNHSELTYEFHWQNSFKRQCLDVEIQRGKGKRKIWEKLLMVEQRIARCCEPTEAKYGQI